METNRRLRQTACIRNGLIPAILVVIFLLAVSVLLNFLYFYAAMKNKIARGAPPVQIWEVSPDYEDPFPTGGNVISGGTSQPPYVRDGKKSTQQTPGVRALTVKNDSPVKVTSEPLLEEMGPGPFPPCRHCFYKVPSTQGLGFAYVKRWIVDCYPEEGLSPCFEGSGNYWQCRLDSNVTWAPSEYYNSTIMCHTLRPIQRPYPEPYPERTRARGKRTPLDFSLDMKYDITNDQLPIMVRIYCKIIGNVRHVWLLQWWSGEENLSSMKPQVLSETRHMGVIRNYDEKSSYLKVWITHSNYSESYQCRAVTIGEIISRTARVSLTAEGKGMVVLEPLLQPGRNLHPTPVLPKGGKDGLDGKGPITPAPLECTACLVGTRGNTLKFKMGKPKSCQNFNLPNCTFGRKQPRLYSQCEGSEGVVCYLPATPGLDECGPCLTKAKVGPRTIVTMIYHTQAPVDCTPQKKTCVSNGTMYNYCIQKNQLVCYQPTTPVRIKVSVWAGLALLDNPKESQLYHLTTVTALKQGQKPITVSFGVCAAMDRVAYRSCGSQGWRQTYYHNHKYLCPRSHVYCQGCKNPSRDLYSPCADRMDERNPCRGWDCVCQHTGGGYPTSPHLGCPYISNFRSLQNSNSVAFEVSRDHPEEESYGIGIDGDGADPLAYITIRVETLKEGEVKSLGWSVYDNLRKLEEPLPLSPKAVNLFVEMAEEVAKALTVKNCFVCGGTNMGEKWPWEALEATPEVYNNMTLKGNLAQRTQHTGIVWTLTTNLVGHSCFSRNGSYPVGHLICLGEWDDTYTKWSSPSNLSQPTKFDLSLLPYLKEPQYSSDPWEAPENMYWICGTLAYEILPADWAGSCVLGWIKPSFFLLPIQSRQVLGIPVYDSIDPIRQKREVNTAFSNFPCKELTEYEKSDTWSSERIVCTYGSATWAEDGSWGYRTPIYMINRIMRLQAVLDLAGERIDKSLNILSTATDKLRTAVYQNRLALDYLLAREGGVCGKFNLSNCCLQIDETGSVIKQLTTEMRQLTHFPGQEWKGLNLASYFSSWLSKLPGWQAIITFIGLIAAGCIIIPCIMPLFVRAISSTLSLMVEKRATAKVLTLMGHTGEEHEYVGLISNREPDTYETPQ